MNPYYTDGYITLYHGDCREVRRPANSLIVTDPPYNVGYGYNEYRDKMPAHEYARLLHEVLVPPCVVIHHMEDMFSIAALLGQVPSKVVAWVYPSNTMRQWRGIAWWSLTPNMSLIKQDYKNPNDKRIKARMARGEQARAYDWWEINQVKKDSQQKTEHPCQIPEEVIRRILVTSNRGRIYDPFAGSGTTLFVAKSLGLRAVGVEMDERYCEIIAKRLSQEVLITA